MRLSEPTMGLVNTSPTLCLLHWSPQLGLHFPVKVRAVQEKLDQIPRIEKQLQHIDFPSFIQKYIYDTH